MLLLRVIDRCQNQLGTLSLARMLESTRSVVEISTPSYQSSIDISTSGLGSHIADAGCRSLSQSFVATICEHVVIENLTNAVVNDHIICSST